MHSKGNILLFLNKNSTNPLDFNISAEFMVFFMSIKVSYYCSSLAIFSIRPLKGSMTEPLEQTDTVH